MGELLILFQFCLIVGCFTGEFTFGILFTVSLFATLFCLLTLFSKTETLTTYGKISFVLGIIGLLYSIGELFLHIDVTGLILG